MIFDRLKSLDPLLLFCVFSLLFLGLLALFSTSQSGGDHNYFVLQIKWILVGVLIMLIVTFMPSRLFYDLAYLAYIFSLILLILVLIWGTKGYGATRWLRIAGIGFQPSELAKITTVFAVARYLADERLEINRFTTFAISFNLIFIPFLLIAKQPDLGTGLAFLVLALPIFFWTGLKVQYVIMILTPGLALLASVNIYLMTALMIIILVYLYYSRPSKLLGSIYFLVNLAVGFLTPYFWSQLKDYQKKRITTFWNPEADPLGAGYQIIQSKVAIGSGGFFGKGFLQGSQTQLRFLPEQHTDFIYAVIGEEFGFLGVLIGLSLFTLLLIRIVQMANLYKNRFSSIIAIGICTIIGFHMFVNIGMTIGLFPVTGLPLPLISYGGTALMTNMAMIGLLLNFYRNRYEY